MFNLTFEGIFLCFTGILFLVADYFVFKKNKALLSDLKALKEWCASTGNNPKDYIKMFKKTNKVWKSELKK